MRFLNIIWDDGDGGNTAHVEEHGLFREEVEFVLENPTSLGFSKSSGLPCLFGYTESRLYIIVIYEQLDADTIYPVTAYEVPEP